MEQAVWPEFLAAALGGAHGVMLTGWLARARFWRDRDDELIPAAREFAANHRRLAMHGDNFDEWTNAHKRLQPVEHFLPLWLQDGLNDQVMHGPDAPPDLRQRHLLTLADALDLEWRSRSRRRQRHWWNRIAWWQLPSSRRDRHEIRRVLKLGLPTGEANGVSFPDSAS